MTNYEGDSIPPYAVLSHTWGTDDEEFTFQDLEKGTGQDRPGYRKLLFCGQQAKKDGLQFFWVDTCCIDKKSSSELQEAINSMFKWYRHAARCYVYLSDVSSTGLSGPYRTFKESRWFTRGWTLQELLAPASLEFFSVEGHLLGDRGSLVEEITDVTGIPAEALQGAALSDFSVGKRLKWSEGRNTKREEDAAYALLGIFNVHMPLMVKAKTRRSSGYRRRYASLWIRVRVLMCKLLGLKVAATLRSLVRYTHGFLRQIRL